MFRTLNTKVRKNLWVFAKTPWMVLAAVVQLTTTQDVEASTNAACALIDEAADLGAQLVVLPENVNFMGSEAKKFALAEPLDGPAFQLMSDRAKARRLVLVAGTLPERIPDEDRVYNTSVVFGPDGARLGHYRKIHLFDVSLGEGATHLESKNTKHGEQAALVQTPVGKLGLTVCYDLRFPDLYRALRREGAELLTVPSAFTVVTGQDHWEVLLRARAIENQAFVLAPAQVGQNGPKRVTYGRSMIIDPWGTVLCTAPDRPGVSLAKIDLEQAHELRRKLPCMSHERPDAYRVHNF